MKKARKIHRNGLEMLIEKSRHRLNSLERMGRASNEEIEQERKWLEKLLEKEKDCLGKKY